MSATFEYFLLFSVKYHNTISVCVLAPLANYQTTDLKQTSDSSY